MRVSALDTPVRLAPEGQAGGAAPGGYRSRVKLVKDRFTRVVKFTTPQAERSINGTVKAMRGLMDGPMMVDGEAVRDEAGETVSRRRFWSLNQAEEALELIKPGAIDQIQALDELADVVYLAKFDMNVTNAVVTNPLFLEKVIQVRDDDGNSLLHWLAAADVPRKLLYAVLKGLRDLHQATEDDKLAAQIAETLRAENGSQVKLHEIAYATKDEGLAAELLRSNVSPREKNRAGTTFVQEVMQTEAGLAYLDQLQEVAKTEKIETQAVKESIVSEEDKRAILLAKASRALLENFLKGDRQAFMKRLQEGLKREPAALALLFDGDPVSAARAKGQFYFGRLDREGRDWLFPVIDLGDLQTVDLVMRVIERHAQAIAEVFAKARPDLDVDEIRRQIMRAYLRTAIANGSTVLHYAIQSRKAIILRRLLDSGMNLPQHVASARTAQKKTDLLQKNLAFLAGRKLHENLFVAACLLEVAGPNVDQDAGTTTVMKMLEVLFEELEPAQAAAMFQMQYKMGRGAKQESTTTLAFVLASPQVLPKVKEAIQLYADNFAAEAGGKA